MPIISFILFFQVIEQSGVVEAHGLRFRNMPAVVTTAVAQMVSSKSVTCSEVASSGISFDLFVILL